MLFKAGKEEIEGRKEESVISTFKYWGGTHSMVMGIIQYLDK